jgi:hypothetical protein
MLLIGCVFLILAIGLDYLASGVGWTGKIIGRYGENIGNACDELSQKKMLQERADNGSLLQTNR